MKTNIKNKLATGLMGALAVVTMATATVMMPAAVDAVQCPTGTKNEGTEMQNYAQCNMDTEVVGEGGTNNTLWETVNTVINVILGVIGILAVIMIIYGGFKMVTSAGAADKVKSGKETILYGVVGLVIALLAFAIVNFVLNSFFTDNPQGSGGGNAVTGKEASKAECDKTKDGLWNDSSKKCRSAATITAKSTCTNYGGNWDKSKAQGKQCTRS